METQALLFLYFFGSVNTMTPNEYQKEALRTASGMSKEYPRILNGLMGLNGKPFYTVGEDK